ncbi:MAG: glycosyltransferase family 2 protein [bacterium]|nr:glycosyltransferase family 2 protein [bacterium]
MKTIDLLWLTTEGSEPHWPLGGVWACAPDPAAIHQTLDELLSGSDSDGVLFWDPTLGPPEPSTVLSAARRPGDLWHAGLRMGMAGLPRLLDTVHPTWMLACDPDPETEATSWRLSLRACLTSTDVLRRMGGPRRELSTLEGASLELGHRYVTRGVLTRHLPRLVPKRIAAAKLPLEDEARFILYRCGRRWAAWALMRAAVAGFFPVRECLRHWRRLRRSRRPAEPAPYRDRGSATSVPQRPAAVSVLIPTLDRYPYLEVLLDQMRRQTVAPLEILVIDQTPTERRRDLAAQFSDLPLKVLLRDRPGQCSSRNSGLQEARGEHILFLDDDDEIAPDLIARHLASLERFGAEASSGVAEEVGAGSLPEGFRLLRSSDVFPTNNTLLTKPTLSRSGLFDLAYERGARADGDLGMRIYLSGALMVLDPGISVLHHHAPSGGLRRHRARVVTYASSRRRLWHRHIPAPTEIYLTRRYFGPRQVREKLWLSALGTFRLHRGGIRRALKLATGALLLPLTVWQIRQSCRRADAMAREYPRIPEMDPGGS